ncbi:MAG TPA: agmatine deiminase family protein [Chitinophagaceae bacterium]
MKKAVIFLPCFFFAVTIFSQGNKEHYIFPAEFEKHEAIWMGWKTVTSRGIDKSETLLKIIRNLTPTVKVNLFIDDDSLIGFLHNQFNKWGIDKNQITMFVYPNPYSNVRDPGPIFLKSNKGNLAIADLKWNFYGNGSSTGPPAKRIDTIDHFVARQLNLPVFNSNLVSEGGAREFNGKGTMMVVEYTERNRNKGWSKDSIEKELLRIFGQKKVIWLEQGLAEDDPDKTYDLSSGKVSTIGCNHIDEFARFSSPNTILLAQVTKEESLKDTLHKISYDRLEKNYRILKNAKDQDGKAFKIIRVPVPEMIIKERKINRNDTALIRHHNLPPEGGKINVLIATSYLNFLVTNGVVLMASYWKPGRPETMRQKDEQAKRILEKSFPGRKVIAINVEILNEGGGGIHCATQQQPKGN